jgi:hypothetical protein
MQLATSAKVVGADARYLRERELLPSLPISTCQGCPCSWIGGRLNDSPPLLAQTSLKLGLQGGPSKDRADPRGLPRSPRPAGTSTRRSNAVGSQKWEPTWSAVSRLSAT